MELLDYTPDLNEDKIGGIVFKTVGGLNAQQIVEAKLSLLQAFTQVQANLLQPKKDKQGAQFKNGQSYKYADLNAVISTIQEASKGIDIAYIQQPVRKGGNAGVCNYILNTKGAIMFFGAYMLDIVGARPTDAGSALTYARRYSISSIFGIASEEDNDAQQFQSAPKFISPNELAALTIMYDGKRTDLATVYAKALAGDELAKQVIKDNSNPVNTKIAIKSIGSIYDFNQRLLNLENFEKKKAEKEEHETKAKTESAGIDPFDVALKGE